MAATGPEVRAAKAEALINPIDVLDSVVTGQEWSPVEALFLTFTFDPGFFERGVLSRCRAAGAIVSVIADANVWWPDPASMRLAGREYLLGFALPPRTFHPKLMLLVGADHALAVVGSGNLTSGGWQHNSELWRTLLAGPGSASPALVGLVGWLDALPAVGRLTGPYADAVQRVAGRLRQLTDRLVSSEGSERILPPSRTVLQMVPDGPVDELTLLAPFIDPQAAAVSALLERLRPARVRVVLQDGATVVEPAALDAALAASGARVEILVDSSSRYRHAKLVEWRVGARRWALTGSANLSIAAMLRTPFEDGNVELSVVEEVAGPVWPAPGIDLSLLQEAQDCSSLRPSTWSSLSRHPTGLPLLLSAVWEGDALLLELSSDCPADVVLQTRTHPLRGEWMTHAPLAVGCTRHRVPARGVDDQAHLRLALVVDGDLRAGGAPVPATDVTAATRPALANRTGRRVASASSLLGGDLGYLEAFGDQLAALAEERRGARSSPQPHDAASKGGTAPSDTGVGGPPTGWRWEQRARGVHGSAIAGFALGLPPGAPGVGWEDFSESTGELAGDSSLTSSTSEPPPTDDVDEAPTDHQRDPEAVKAARRRWVADYANFARWERTQSPADAASSSLSGLSWLAVARLALVFYCAGNWDPDDESPLQHLAELIDRLAVIATVTEPAGSSALAAVAVTSIRQRAEYSLTADQVAAAERAEKAARRLLGEGQIEDQLVAEYCRCLRTPAERGLDAETVFAHLDRLLHNELDQAVKLLEQRGWPYEEWSSQVLWVEQSLGDPGRAAAELMAGSTGPLAIIVGSSASAQAGLALWTGSDLYVVRSRPSPRWEHFTSPLGLEAVLASWRNEQRTRYRVQHGALTQPIVEAEEWFERLGLSDRLPRRARAARS